MNRLCRAPALGLGLLLLAGTALESRSFEEAAELLERAEKQAEIGHYAKAVALYKRLAKEFPQTPEGAIGARRSKPNALLGTADLLRHGPSKNRVDVVILGDGYTIEHLDQFDTVAQSVPEAFERNEVFGEYFEYLNFVRASVVSAEDGVDEYGREYDTALGGRRSGAIQGQVAVDPQRVRQFLGEVEEHDGMAVAFVKLGLLGTGGGGIATIGGRSDETLIHEWGHAFAGLGDEYSANTGHRGEVGRKVNVSDTDDAKKVPWKHFLEAHVPGIGVYHGADGRAKGAFKPTGHCIMGAGGEYCPVCREAIVLRIHELLDPLERCEPPPHRDRKEALHFDSKARPGDRRPVEFTIQVLEPKTHDLEVSFWVLPLDYFSTHQLRTREIGERRGPLAPIDEEPAYQRQDVSGGTHTFEYTFEKLPPGAYRVICRVEDDTKVRGSSHPWVLKDPDDLLWSERTWFVVVE